MNCTVGSGDGSLRVTGSVKNVAYCLVPSALNTCPTLALDSGLAMRNRYLPGGSATPGRPIGALKVK